MKIGYFSIMALILVFFTTFTVGQTIYKQDYEKGIQRDIYNYTENSLKWEKYTSNTSLNNNESIDYSKTRIQKVLNSFINFLGTTTMEGAKFGVEYGYNNPQINYQELLIKLTILFKWFVYLYIGVLLVKLLIPLFVILYILGDLIYNFVIKIKKKQNKKKVK